ncbi:MAG: hypothetical protein Kow0020_11660 [Wenzhouxiangellaceae bacterium]
MSGTLAQSVLNLLALYRIGAPVTIADAFGTMLFDLAHFLPRYGLLITAALAVAWPVAAWLAGRCPRWRCLLYLLAGASAIAVMLVSMKCLLGLTPIAAARSTIGISALASTGALGGWLYCRWRKLSEASVNQSSTGAAVSSESSQS